MTETSIEGNLSEAREDLAFIRRIMEDSRRLAKDDGSYFIIWGLISVVMTGLSYALAYWDLAALIPYVWPVVFGLAGGAMAVFSRKTKEKKPRSLTERLLSGLWLSVLFLMAILIGSAWLSGKLSLAYSMGLAAAALALGFTLSALISQSRPLAFLALPWWLGGLFLPMLPAMIAPLGLAGLTLFFEVIPGFVMKSRVAPQRPM